MTANMTDTSTDTLRRLLPPGSTLCVTVEVSRSGSSARAVFRALDLTPEPPHLAVCTADVADVLGVRYVVSRRAAILPADTDLTELADRLSLALYGQPGQIKGEYL